MAALSDQTRPRSCATTAAKASAPSRSPGRSPRRKLAPIAAETKRLLADPAHLDGILRDGATRAAAIADPIVDEAERLVGFLKP